MLLFINDLKTSWQILYYELHFVYFFQLPLMPTTESIKKDDLMNKSPDELDVKTSLIKTVTNLSPDSHKEMESQGQNHKGKEGKPNKKDDRGNYI